jgi:hypothetical protein
MMNGDDGEVRNREVGSIGYWKLKIEWGDGIVW